MGTWEDLQTGWQSFQNWLGSIGQTLSETYGQLSQGILSGLMWLGSKFYEAFEWIYNGLVWIADRLKEAYETLSEWVSTGLQWIGAGLSWLGANFYKLGHWIYNGVVTFVRWVIIALKAIYNWFAGALASIWNGLCSLPSTFVEGFNDFINSFVLSAREKFKSLMFVNLTIPIMGKQIERIPERVSEAKSMWGMAGAILTPFVTPLATLVLSEVIDAMVPRPSSTNITIFPTMFLPELTPASLEVSLPDEPVDPDMVVQPEPLIYETPGAIPYTAAGYTAEGEQGAGIGLAYEITVDYGGQVSKSCGIGLSHECFLE